jgi:HlyD family secretion protein
VRVRIFTAEKSGALTVPRSTLFRGAAGQWRLFTVRDGRATLTPVALGLMNDERAEVLEGVADGDLVILAPETNLTEGQAVKPRRTLEAE